MTIIQSKRVEKQNRRPRSGRSEATVWTVIVSSKVLGKAGIQSGDMKASPLIKSAGYLSCWLRHIRRLKGSFQSATLKGIQSGEEASPLIEATNPDVGGSS